MKRTLTILFFLIIVLATQAQQSVLYSQFMMNDYGLNPAVAGSAKNWVVMMGRRTQWRGFEYAPETNFASVVKDFGKKGLRRYWHGLGAYVEQDKYGAFTTQVIYGSYAVHLKLSGKYNMSMGLAAGMKTVQLTNSIYDINDPAAQTRSAKVRLYPDLIPGIYIYSRKLSFSISVRNIYKNTLRQGNTKIGTPTKLPQVAYVVINRKFRSANYDYVFVPAIQIQSTFIGLPITQFNCMTYYRKRVGVGLTYRMHDAISAMIQVRIWSNFVVGFAYDYTISRFRSANANSTEIMVGYSPVMGPEDYKGKTNVSKCPNFDY
ncbi:MAG: PorP/SprF family type IX secretion system membrane protein [Bacteroidota bacterium]